ncbi:hypothetical protein MKX01_020619 [Papaver californicum]|nr:hypothetical protein MKX01_020619 [Papaver californicum]
MAAGRNGSYRDNDLKERESETEVTKRREFYSQKEEYDRFGSNCGSGDRGMRGSREFDMKKGRDAGDEDSRERFTVRQKDIEEREVCSNSVYRSSSSPSSMSNSGSGGGNDSSGRRRGGAEVSVRTAGDREPGELSSGSGSDDGDLVSESRVSRDNEVSKPENGLDIKRKFTSIVWNREAKERNNTSADQVTVSTSSKLPPPPMPKSLRQSPNVVIAGGVQISPIIPNRLPSPPPSLAKPPIASSSARSAVSESSEASSPSPANEHQWSNDQQPGQLEEDDYVSTRNISASRWADESNSPGNVGESSDREDLSKRRKKSSVSGLFNGKVKKKSTPELDELRREGSVGNRIRSSESGGGRNTGSASEGEYPDRESSKNDYMEVEEEDMNRNESAYYSDSDSDEGRDSARTPEPIAPPHRSINMLQECRSVDEYQRLNKIDEGTYGVVYRAKDKKTGEIVALKKVKMEKEREGFPLTSLREINILLSFHHESIVDVKEVVVGSNLDSIFMAMEYMEHDLKGLMESMKQPFSQSEVKCLMLQLLEGVKYLHDNWVLHRDLKTSNLLLNNRGDLKICDFGLSRQYGSPLKPYTHLVVTLWYRAPELLLGAKLYSTAIDMWSLGCIMAEFLGKKPLFTGKTEVDQLDKIFRILGTPNETIWPGFSKLPGVKVNFVKHPYNLLLKKFPATSFTGFDLLNKLLTYDPEKRITAEDALNHQWFREVPLPKSKDFMPTFPAQHAQDRRLRRVMKSPDPLEEQRRKELKQRELGTTGLFGQDKQI